MGDREIACPEPGLRVIERAWILKRVRQPEGPGDSDREWDGALGKIRHVVNKPSIFVLFCDDTADLCEG